MPADWRPPAVGSVWILDPEVELTVWSSGGEYRKDASDAFVLMSDLDPDDDGGYQRKRVEEAERKAREKAETAET